jgi:uncharacterized protein (DUF2236 family)
MSASAVLPLPRWVHARLEAEAARFLFDGEDAVPDFSAPHGEPALAAADSISWRVYKNPVSLFIGGVTAVLLELAEPRVRSGVWDHTSFRTDPVRRLRRTGLAAMMTIYGPRSEAQAMIARVRRIHERVEGVTPDGVPYSASDPELLNWVHATAAFGFIQAYRLFARPLGEVELARFYGEGGKAASLYGATDVPRSEADVHAFFAAMRPKLEPSPIIFDFLRIMQHAPVLPAASRPLQRMMVRAGVAALPAWARELLELEPRWSLAGWERRLIRMAGALADRIPIAGSPPVEACRRIGLTKDYLYRH